MIHFTVCLSCSCPNSSADDESRSPVLCLICNAMLCSQSYCCQVEVGNRQTIGAATAHAQSCAAGNGIFLRYAFHLNLVTHVLLWSTS